jgi:hypothetical protein
LKATHGRQTDLFYFHAKFLYDFVRDFIIKLSGEDVFLIPTAAANAFALLLLFKSCCDMDCKFDHSFYVLHITLVKSHRAPVHPVSTDHKVTSPLPLGLAPP